eukprot:scaffold2374_cov78-Skeletonema_dohrnii-CCMP3373.AAC.6
MLRAQSRSRTITPCTIISPNRTLLDGMMRMGLYLPETNLMTTATTTMMKGGSVSRISSITSKSSLVEWASNLPFGDKDVRTKLSGYVLGSLWSERHGYNGARIHDLRPLSDFLGDLTSVEDSDTMNLFHRDESGKATFTAEEAAAASNYVASMNLDERVLAAVQKKRFELTQEVEEKDDYYCNESTYSNLSLLYVTGLIRLDPSIQATSTAVAMPRKKFEKVWPTKEHRKAALVAAKKHFEDMGIGEYVPSYFYTDDYFHFHGYQY